jgi:hypothetical protein
MLTIATMRQILAAAFDCAEDGVRPTLDALGVAALIPTADDMALDASHVVAVTLAFLAWVPPHAVALETVRFASFHAPALGGTPIGLLLLAAIEMIRALARPIPVCRLLRVMRLPESPPI